MKKIIRTSTVPVSLYTFARKQLVELKGEYDVVAVSSPGEDLEKLHEECGVRAITVPMERHISLLRDFKSLIRMICLFRKERPDMVHSITPKAGLVSMLAAWLTRVPVRMHTFTGLVFPTSTGLKRRILILMDKLICACATYVNPEGYGVANDLKRFGVTKKPLHIIANGNVRGIDMEHYDRTPEVMAKAEGIRKEGVTTFCFIGRLVRDKGINELVASFDRLHREHPNTRLILIGGYEEKLDPLAPETMERIKQGDGIEYVGRQSDVRPWLAASDIFVFPSYREGFPNTVIEAGAMGLASIVTDINGSNEIIIQGENGEIIPSKDADALYIKMKEWYENPTKVQAMAANARKLVGDRYEQQMIQLATIAVYKELLGEK